MSPPAIQARVWQHFAGSPLAFITWLDTTLGEDLRAGRLLPPEHEKGRLVTDLLCGTAVRWRATAPGGSFLAQG